MRILVATSSEIRGGAESYLLTIARSAARAGSEVHAAFPPREQNLSLAEELRRAGVTFRPLEITEPKGGWWNRRGTLTRALRMGARLVRVRPQLVHMILPWPGHCFGPLLACAGLGVPTLATFQLVAESEVVPPGRRRLVRWMQSRRQRWVAVSEHNRQLLAESFGMPTEEITLIYNGAPALPPTASMESAAGLRSSVRARLGVGNDTSILLTVGRLDDQKGHRQIVEALPRLLSERPDLVLAWAGDGPLRQALAADLRRLGLDSHVLILGQRNDVSDLLRAADLFLFPSLFEGLPFALLEAMAHGLPVVASDAASIPEIVHDGVHGLLFSAGDVPEMAEKVLWALGHPREMAEMATRASVRRLDFTEQRMVESTLRLMGEYASLRS